MDTADPGPGVPRAADARRGDGRSGTVAPVRTVLAICFVLLLVALVGVALGERAARRDAGWLEPVVSSPEDVLAFDELRVPVPYTMYEPQEGFDWPDGPPLDGEYRIVMLGGSTVVYGDPPLPQLLERELHRAGFAQATVYNFGVVSQNSTQELVRLALSIQRLDPALVLLYDGGNDIMDPALSDPRPGYPFNYVVWENNPLLLQDPRAYPAGPLILKSSALARRWFPGWYHDAKLLPRVPKLRREVGHLSQEWSQTIARTYVENLSTAAALAGAFEAELVALFQPMVFTKQPLVKDEQKILSEFAPEIREHVRRTRANALSLAARAGPEVGLRFVDLGAALDQYEGAAFKDCLHLFQPAREAMAVRLVSALTPIIEGRGETSGGAGAAARGTVAPL